MTSIDICICTFRRDHITDTLLSLGKLRTESDWILRVIVADNDDTPTAQMKVQQAAHALPFTVVYLHAPKRNISIARNACLDAAEADYIAFLDDDEIAHPDWLIELITTARKETADAVLGPVNAIYPDNAPAWMSGGDFHATRPVWVNGEIITGYTCNLLLKRTSPAIEKARFRIDLGRTGGEDTVFLSTLHQNGGKIAYAEKALLEEPVPSSRASVMWLIKRRFRSGQTHALLLLEQKGQTATVRIKHTLIAATKALVCFSMAACFFWNPENFIKNILRGALHIGVIARLCGKKDLVQYG